MRKSKLSYYTAFLLTLFSVSSSQAQGFLRAEGQRIVNAAGENVLLRGMGLGGWMLQEGYMLRVGRDGQQHKIRERIDSLLGPEKTARFYESWLANHCRKVDVDSMKQWGFNSIRLPLHYNLFTLPVEKEPVAGENTWLEKGFGLVDSLLSWCRDNHIYLILDMHAAPGGQGNDLNISDRDPSQPSLWQSKANQQKMIALWTRLARRYANEPWIGGYDIINEPNWGFQDPQNDRNGLKESDNGPLRSLMMEITRAIRGVDKKHIIIIEGNGWGNNYKGIFPLWDDNIVLSFHKYWNYNDQASIQHILDARSKYNVPVWLGETGENSNTWFTQAIRLLENNNIGWSWWPLKKIGNNNPLEIRNNPYYQQILDFWNGSGARPSSEDAWEGLSQLANDSKLENCIYHKDVIDAMFRQPKDPSAIPFAEHTILPGAVINMSDYDLGPNGVAYLDMDTADYHVSTAKRSAGNRGRVCRNDGVDLFPMIDETQGYYVGHIEKGEWLQFTVDVKKPGTYSLVWYYNATAHPLNLALQMDQGKLRQLVLPANNGWQEMKQGQLHLPTGRHQLRVYFKGEGGELHSLLLLSATHK